MYIMKCSYVNEENNWLTRLIRPPCQILWVIGALETTGTILPFLLVFLFHSSSGLDVRGCCGKYGPPQMGRLLSGFGSGKN